MLPRWTVAAAAALSLANAEGEKMMVYDCELEQPSWETSWGLPKKAFCCKKMGLGCKPFDCTFPGKEDPASWSMAKATYCCDSESLGCSVVDTCSNYGCGIEYVRGKRCQCNDLCPTYSNCCEDYKQLCVQVQEPIAAAPDAAAAQANIYEKVDGVGGWGGVCTCPDGQKYNVGDNKHACASLACIGGTSGACEQSVDEGRKGMQVTCKVQEPIAAASNAAAAQAAAPAQATYDCEADKEHWESDWSKGKKDFCCKMHGTHVSGRTSGFLEDSCDQFECDRGHQHDWSPDKLVWCCDHHSKGCAQIVNCHAGLHDWEKLWPADKKELCCRSTGKPCERYQCSAVDDKDSRPDTARWTPQKHQWCCTHNSKGCDAPSIEDEKGGVVLKDEVDCKQGVDNWRFKWAWPPDKLELCCQDDRERCTPFDCSSVDSQSAWTMAQRSWCCMVEKVACEPLQSAASFNATQPSEATSAIAPQAAAKGVAEKYDCRETDLNNFHHGWSYNKMRWCCEKSGTGCEHNFIYDCAAGADNWHAWSVLKKRHCCEQEHVGCETGSASSAGTLLPGWNPDSTTAAPVHYECSTQGLGEQAWSIGQREYCCKTVGVACDHFDCEAGADPDTWGRRKQMWCCHREGKGCSQILEPLHSFIYDCSSGNATGQQDWSQAKKASCCKQAGIGCYEPFDCKDVQNAAKWPASQGAWCCSHRRIGCQFTVAPFNCALGRELWERRWNVAKKSYCCKTEGWACQLYDCSTDLATWNTKKQAWCCGKEDKGCPRTAPTAPTWTATAPTAPTAPTFDCEVGDEEAWGPEQKLYCCQSAGKACVQYDCSTVGGSVLGKAMTVEAKRKDAWCCVNKQIGCEATDASFDCPAQADDWESWPEKNKVYCCQSNQKGLIDWSEERKAYCCQLTGVACFDCSAGADNWEKGWSAVKKKYCCQSAGKACDTVVAVRLQQYDCSTVGGSLGKAMTVEAKRKEAWCCVNKQVGCEATHSSFDCPAQADDWESWPEENKVYCCSSGNEKGLIAWSEERKAYCCQQTGVACFDCSADAEIWEKGWSAVKKKYCCEHGGGFACEPYNCLEESAQQWSDEKHSWCCQNTGLCDCQTDAEHWATKWTPQQQKYCCVEGNANCPGMRDCDRLDDIATWPEVKQEYCCIQFNVLCPDGTVLVGPRVLVVSDVISANDASLLNFAIEAHVMHWGPAIAGVLAVAALGFALAVRARAALPRSGRPVEDYRSLAAPTGISHASNDVDAIA